MAEMKYSILNNQFSIFNSRDSRNSRLIKSNQRRICEICLRRQVGSPDAPIIDQATAAAAPAKSYGRFTLVELLVVIGIIGLLAALSFPLLSKVKAKSKMAKCAGNLHQIGVRLHAYADDNDGYLPVCARIGVSPADPLAMQNVMPMNSSEIYECPADDVRKFSGMTFYEKHGSSYEWNAWFNGRKLDRHPVLDSLLGTLPAVWDSADFHGKLGHNFLYEDGQVKAE